MIIVRHSTEVVSRCCTEMSYESVHGWLMKCVVAEKALSHTVGTVVRMKVMIG